MIVSKETFETISKYGFATVAAVALSWVAYEFIVLPANEERMDAREERKATAKALVEANRESNVTTRSLANSYEKLTNAVDSQTSILRDIRDDQKKFPAVREANAKPEQP